MDAQVRGLAALPPFTIGETTYTGSYFAMLLAIDWEVAAQEAERTPQLIYELGHIAAQAKQAKEAAEAAYRVWREGVFWDYAVGPDAVRNAIEAGFQTARNPGVDAKGQDKPAKAPSKADVESYMRTLPEYLEHQTAQAQAELAWSTAFAAYEAAKARQAVLRNWDPELLANSARRTLDRDSVEEPSVSQPSPKPVQGPTTLASDNDRGAPVQGLDALEQAYSQQSREHVPPPSPPAKAPPPPPPVTAPSPSITAPSPSITAPSPPSAVPPPPAAALPTVAAPPGPPGPPPPPPSNTNTDRSTT